MHTWKSNLLINHGITIGVSKKADTLENEREPMEMFVFTLRQRC